jgi:uncharacterized protein
LSFVNGIIPYLIFIHGNRGLLVLIWLFLAVIGLFVGTLGTILGVAGGFILVPILLYVYPDRTPSVITAMSLTVAFFNALSGSFAYFRLHRIDLYSGLLFSISAIPGAVIGAITNSYLNRHIFQLIFGSILVIAAIYLFFKPSRNFSGKINRNGWQRHIVDSYGNAYTYSYNRVLGIIISFFIGIISGLLGIGGGIIHVPVLTQVLGFPVYIATATSQFVVGTSTFSAGITHIFTDSFSGIAGETLVLALGAVIGAQFGARISHKIPAVLIVRILAVALIIVAVRLLISAM